ncbi:MAG TPA: D-sedoheptulose 7-phosphate isomerase [Bacteroidales bacterium]|jgi:D-sedoheptulose 7-phosphate isomerase|nr:D-sedoheptulose 7-phosphate isomerase [Bacteroidales bacterium]HQB20207.1 D-sedoheptulose 7-phosphate isomerase [Bacteroidales bacterium]
MRQIRVKEAIEENIELMNSILHDTIFMSQISQLADIMVKSLRRGGTIFFCGNGGSAADAQHLAAELSGRFYFDRAPLPAEALHCNTSYLTAIANDYGFEHVYERLIRGNGKKGDVLVGLSTSGNSLNITKAFETAKNLDITTIAFTGENGGKLKEIADYILQIPSTDTPRIQEAHILIGHIICELIETEMFIEE